MKKLFSLLIILFSIHFYPQTDSCLELKNGVFELYENQIKIGKIYRCDGIQIEVYENDSEYLIAKYINEDSCLYHLKAYEIERVIDTITWQVSYKKINEKEFSFEGKPAFIDFVDFSYKGKLRKISDNIRDKNIRKKFDKLLKNSKKGYH